MGLLPSLPDRESMLVADTSVIINLNATGCAEAILKALPHRVVVVDIVVDELEEGAQKGRQDALKLAALIKAKLIKVVKLGEEGLVHFERLVVGTASETLDDGEAATIAYAAQANAKAIIDERKANRLCATRFPSVPLGCTVDMLVHDDVQRALGPARLADAVHSALVGARMRVMAHYIDRIVGLIGDKRVAECPCLPESVRRQAQARL